jgi:hypothetical protein
MYEKNYFSGSFKEESFGISFGIALRQFSTGGRDSDW